LSRRSITLIDSATLAHIDAVRLDLEHELRPLHQRLHGAGQKVSEAIRKSERDRKRSHSRREDDAHEDRQSLHSKRRPR
jgi:hypothetical protein